MAEQQLATAEQLRSAEEYFPAIATLPDEERLLFATGLSLYQQWVGTPPESRRPVVAAAAIRLRRSQRSVVQLFAALARTQDLRLLLPTPRADKGRARAWDALALEYLRDRYTNLRNKGAAYKETTEVCELTGWRVGSYHACTHMSTWDKEGRQQAKMALVYKGKDYEDKYELPILRDKSYLKPLEIVCGDHHQFDCVVIWPNGELVRPWLSAWIDVRTGLWLGLTVCRTPDAKSIADSMYTTIRRFGMPEMYYIDNGKAYRAAILKGTRFELDEIGMIGMAPDVQATLDALQQGLYGASRQIHALPFNARAKIVERHFGTGGISDWCKTLPGYTGRRYDEMPDATRRMIKSRRGLLRLDEFLVRFIHHVREHNERPSRGQGMGGKSPIEVLAWYVENGWRPTSPPDLAILDILASRKVPRTLTRYGLQLMGTTNDPVYYYDERMRSVATGTKVLAVWSDSDLIVREMWAANEEGRSYRAVPARIRVYMMTGEKMGQFICEAQPVERARYIDDPNTGERIREQRRRRKELKSEIEDSTAFRQYIDASPDEAARLASGAAPEPAKLRLVKVDRRSDFEKLLDEERKKRSYLDLAHRDEDDHNPTINEAEHDTENG